MVNGQNELIEAKKLKKSKVTYSGTCVCLSVSAAIVLTAGLMVCGFVYFDIVRNQDGPESLAEFVLRECNLAKSNVFALNGTFYMIQKREVNFGISLLTKASVSLFVLKFFRKFGTNM